MRLELGDPFWIVEDPSPTSVIEDICWATSLAGIENQLRGGWTMTRRPTLHTTREEAERDARARLTFRDEFARRPIAVRD